MNMFSELKYVEYFELADYYDMVMLKYCSYDEQFSFIDKVFEKYEIKNKCDILDLACGTGIHSINLSRKGFNVIGVDYSSDMIRNAKNKSSEAGLKIDFRIHDMRSLKIDKKFDAVICLNQAIMHMLTQEDIKACIKVISNLLKDNGIFIFDFVTPHTFGTANSKEDACSNNIQYELFRKTTYNNLTQILLEEKTYYITENNITKKISCIEKRRCYCAQEMLYYLNQIGKLSILSVNDCWNFYKEAKGPYFVIIAGK